MSMSVGLVRRAQLLALGVERSGWAICEPFFCSAILVAADIPHGPARSPACRSPHALFHQAGFSSDLDGHSGAAPEAFVTHGPGYPWPSLYTADLVPTRVLGAAPNLVGGREAVAGAVGVGSEALSRLISRPDPSSLLGARYTYILSTELSKNTV